MFRRLSSKAKLTFSLMVVFLFSITGTVFGDAKPPQTQYNYVALGDSLAAGQNPYGVEHGYGYTNAIQNYLDQLDVAGSYKNFGISGMTSKELKSELTTNPKMIKAIQSAGQNSIITLDIGADDMLPLLDWATKYPGSATEEWLSSYPGSFPSLTGESIYPLTYRWAWGFPSEINGSNDITKIVFLIGYESTVVQTNITDILGTIHGLNGNAQIYLMGYYDAFANYDFTPAQKALYDTYFITMLDTFNSGLYAIANHPAFSSYVTFVSTFGDVSSDMLPGDIHPNKAGYISIANEFWTEILATQINP